MNKDADLYITEPKVYPRSVKGRFTNLRTIAAWILLGLYYGFPWLQWEGRQAVLFDLPARKFHWFELTLWPQDFFYLAWLLIMAALLLFLTTALAGRLWCGYACPQTVWTKTFLWIERVIEGDRNQRMKLDRSPLSFKKVFLKTSKHSSWLLFAAFTGFTFVGYFTPIRELTLRLFYFSLGSWEVFWIIFYSFATYGNAGWLREQLCKYMCPYARFQSAMFDADTLIISYDSARGEPRGKRSKLDKAELGDCINCQRCVQVCPTGIDIRDGLQYECIGCAACVDVCDEVMDKLNHPRGLVRYTTEHALQQKKTHVLRPRVWIYSTILATLFVSFILSLSWRTPLRLDVIRDRNHLYQTSSDGTIENVYTLKILNMDEEAHQYKIHIEGIDANLRGQTEILVPAGNIQVVPVRVSVRPSELSEKSNIDIIFRASSIDRPNYQVETKARFIGPTKKRSS